MLRVSNQTRVQAYANDTSLSRTQKAAPGDDFVVVRFPLSSNWKGRIESLRLNFKAQKGTFIEIDSIVVERI